MDVNRGAIPDYCGDKEAAMELKERFEAYYHKRGYKWVKAWLEIEKRDKSVLYCLRSNIQFTVPT